MMIKGFFISLAWFGLVLTFAAPILYFLNAISRDRTHSLLLLGTVLWMLFAGLWMWPRRTT